MSKGNRLPWGLASDLSKKLVDALTPSCERIMICGSIRREKQLVGDAEVVALVREHRMNDLFGQSVNVGRTYLDDAIDQLAENEYLGWAPDPRRQGAKHKVLRHKHTGLTCDLYVVTDQRAFGSTIAVRTGPHQFSVELMRKALSMGMFFGDGFLLHGHRPRSRKDRCPEGPNCDQIIPLRLEADVFEILKIPYLYPKLREDRYGSGL